MKSIIILVSILSLFSSKAISQIPTIKAVGGGGTNVDWLEEKKNTDPEGPGYFYNDCAQGVDPIKASSTLAPQGKNNYSVKNLSDDSPMTAWVEGKSDYGIGEWFEIKAINVNVIYNGYQSSPISWINNSRVKKFKVYKNNHYQPTKLKKGKKNSFNPNICYDYIMERKTYLPYILE